MVLCNVKSRCISQEITVCFKPIHCSWKCDCKTMSIWSKVIVYMRKLMSSIFFLKYFTVNYVLNFLQWKILQWKIPYGKCIKTKNQKWKYYDFMLAINCTCKLTCVRACACVRDRTHLFLFFSKIIPSDGNTSLGYYIA